MPVVVLPVVVLSEVVLQVAALLVVLPEDVRGRRWAIHLSREATPCKAKLNDSQWSAKQGCTNPQQVEGEAIDQEHTAERGVEA